MSHEDEVFLTRINSYATAVIPDTDPQKVPISKQLEQLKPVMQEIAHETGDDLSSVFIRYMDLQSIAIAEKDREMREREAEKN